MASENSEKESMIHPAAAVFRNVIAGEITEENRNLIDDIVRLEPLLDHFQKVEVMAAVDIDGCVKKQSLAAVQLNEGTIVKHGDDEKLNIPIESSHNVLLRNLNFSGGIEVHLAGHRLGNFPHTTYGNVAGYTSVSFDEDDTAHLTIHVSRDVSIYGELKGLSGEDIAKLKEEDGDSYLVATFVPVFGHFHIVDGVVTQVDEIDTSSPTFVPSMIQMNLVRPLKERLKLIDKTDTSSENSSEGMTSAEELRHLTFAALGEVEHNALVADNMRLKHKQRALMNIRHFLMSVSIVTRETRLDVSLEKGELETDERGNQYWSIKMMRSDDGAIPVYLIKQSGFLLSGMQMNVPGSFLRPDQRFVLLHTENNPVTGLRIPYADGIDLVGLFNWYFYSGDEIFDVTENFHARLHGATSAGTITVDDVPVEKFPPTFKLEVLEVRFSLKLVEPILKMAGLADKLSLNNVAPDE